MQRIVLMGGAIGAGNVTPAAEFNIWADPEAALRVFTSGIDLVMVGLDVTHRALLRSAGVQPLAAAGRAGRLLAETCTAASTSRPTARSRCTPTPRASSS